MRGAFDRDYGVRCGVCGGLFAGVGPSDDWGHNSSACASETLPKLHARIAELEDALRLILPMAKGYAAEHRVGDNEGKVQHAERALQNEPIK